MTEKPEVAEGARFGRLVVASKAAKVPNGRQGLFQSAWNCLCDCGKMSVVTAYRLRSGRTISCGCYRSETSSAMRKEYPTVPVHGHSAGKKLSPTYVSWAAMIQRCFYEKNKRYQHYGGRGITVCEKWKDFKNFLADMGERPEGKTIDRINVDGNYEPSNCRWATPNEQANNKQPIIRTSKSCVQ